MIAVAVVVARTLDVLGEVDAVVGEYLANAAQHGEGIGLVVDRIECGHEVECCGLRRAVEVGEITDLEMCVGVA